jgi:hypothetical protein
MKLDFTRIMLRANMHYAEAKLGKDAVYAAPEQLPKIQSDQVKAVLKALIEEINKEERHG